MITIKLYGHLGKSFGKVFKFDVNSVPEAIRLLCANFPTFKEEVCTQKAAGYWVFINNSKITLNSFLDPIPDGDEIRIVPVVAGKGGGGGGGFFDIIAGAALIYFSMGAAAPTMAGAEGIAGTAGGWATQAFGQGMATVVANVMSSVGSALVMGGISKLLYQPPPVASQSSNLGSITNTTKQGECVPLGYGRRIIGSAVVSAGLSTIFIV